MKHYYVKYPRNFANEYSLFSAEANSMEEKELIERGFDRITRKRAEDLCYQEKYRRKYDRAMSGYAPSSIEPYELCDY